ncbi:MAG TPA: aminotransferase class I/II-fold pyridoxal phosphate-dependent enzyme [Aggregatilinea sp.]|jgi:8-amino-7-oxononanoate synthase|uniref:aminotransferase class I/II-fold pyridoxal phosphate-dependent enzyme n=1 Tax=Aggregatilinea sp. TaxID=2806333 RepID=UPI002B740B42|nr:aminotransferase class I/II-fold pyridoxal phosphate-dependent enzyme [Aggregatilinea sp.]HML23642.1 aminotransferase class I/II-fold pyridoxal phosphate-dependent enzyme [Aggregatilinea sp.]
MDLFEKTRTFTRAKEAIEMGVYPYFQPLSDSEGTMAIFKGHEVVMIGSNNYLGLTTHPKVRQAAIDAIEKFGTSCTGSRFLNGTLEFHLELDRRLAKFVGKEAALVFSTGYQTNVGTISALVQKGDFVIIDKDDHASIVDGCMLSRGEMRRFNHNDPDSLDKALSRIPEDAGKLVVVDGVYSMGGDIAPLPTLVEICKRYGARIMVDDAHSLGVLADGRGTAAHFGLTDEVDLIMGTFSKSFASIGGFIAGSEQAIHYIQHNARSLLFSASLPAPQAAAVLAALDVIESEPEHVQRLWDNAEYMRAGLHRLGYDTGPSQTPVIPLMIRDEYRTVLAWHALVEEGVYTNPVVPPGVPANSSLLRTSYMATHTKDQLDIALRGLEVVGHNLDLIPQTTSLETA